MFLLKRVELLLKIISVVKSVSNYSNKRKASTNNVMRNKEQLTLYMQLFSL